MSAKSRHYLIPVFSMRALRTLADPATFVTRRELRIAAGTAAARGLKTRVAPTRRAA